MVEKPLTGTLEGDRDFAAELDAQHPNSLMLAFQRRFDAPLMFAKELVDSGLIGKVFKVYSALEDSNPAPNGYASGGILPDMSVHNVDEILWLTGRMPTHALSIGSRVYSHKLTTCDEDFDDASLYMWFGDDLLAQVQVTRNHVSGYRVETILFGEKGQVHVGHFDGKLFEVTVEAYGKRGREEPLAKKTFTARNYGKPLPEFVDRFGAAYKLELQTFIQCCNENKQFPSNHHDGLRAQEVYICRYESCLRQSPSSARGGQMRKGGRCGVVLTKASSEGSLAAVVSPFRCRGAGFSPLPAFLSFLLRPIEQASYRRNPEGHVTHVLHVRARRCRTGGQGF